MVETLITMHFVDRRIILRRAAEADDKRVIAVQASKNVGFAVADKHIVEAVAGQIDAAGVIRQRHVLDLSTPIGVEREGRSD